MASYFLPFLNYVYPDEEGEEKQKTKEHDYWGWSSASSVSLQNPKLEGILNCTYDKSEVQTCNLLSDI